MPAGDDEAVRPSDAATPTPAPFGIHFSHGRSHSALASPKTTKNMRHPTCATSNPPTTVPSAGPPAHPADTMPFARPRCDAWKCVTIILFTAGYDADSPMPNSSRAVSSSAKLRTNPVLSVAADHSDTPSASSQFTLKRSTAQPDRIWQNA